MLVHCHYVGFGNVYSIEFATRTETLYKSNIVTRHINAETIATYTFENVAFYMLMNHIKAFLNQYDNVHKMIVYTAIESSVINEAMKNPKTEAEVYLAELYANRLIDFDTRGDAKMASSARFVAQKYRELKKNGQDVKFGSVKANPFDDIFADRYNVYN